MEFFNGMCTTYNSILVIIDCKIDKIIREAAYGRDKKSRTKKC